MPARKSLWRSQPQEEHADGFAEQAIYRLSVLQLDLIPEGSKSALCSDHRVDYRVHREIEIGTQVVQHAVSQRAGLRPGTSASRPFIP
jgi:hypothetical protein